MLTMLTASITSIGERVSPDPRSAALPMNIQAASRNVVDTMLR